MTEASRRSIERLAGRVSFGRPIPGSAAAGSHIGHVPQVRLYIAKIGNTSSSLIEGLDLLSKLAGLISSAIRRMHPHIITEGNIARTGFDETDQYRLVLREGTG